MHSTNPDAEAGDRDATIRLLQEKLTIDRSKRKVGEVVVRKEVKTRMVQIRVPVRRERLIVEQVSPELKILAEIDLAEEVVADATTLATDNVEIQPLAIGEFSSPQAASDILAAIALQKPHGCKQVRVEILLEDPRFQAGYQQMCDRLANGQ